MAIYCILKEKNDAGLAQIPEEYIRFYILDSDISSTNKALISKMVGDFGTFISFIDAKEIHQEIVANVNVPVRSFSTYLGYIFLAFYTKVSRS